MKQQNKLSDKKRRSISFVILMIAVILYTTVYSINYIKVRKEGIDSANQVPGTKASDYGDTEVLRDDDVHTEIRSQEEQGDTNIANKTFEETDSVGQHSETDMAGVYPEPTKKAYKQWIQDFSYEDAINDYNYFCSLLDDSYPTGGVIERQYGIKVSDIKEKFLIRLNERKEDMTMEAYADLLYEAVDSFRETSHFALVNPELYQYYQGGVEGDKDSTTKRALNNKKGREIYNHFLIYGGGPWKDENKKSPFRQKGSDPGETFFEILEDDIAYIGIPIMFSNEVAERDWERFDKFYKNIADCPNLIIDITGNPGGSDWYWLYNVFKPNIDEPVKRIDHFFMKQSPLNIKYAEEQVNGFQSLAVEIENAYKLPKINLDDVKKFDRLYALERTIYPRQHGKKAYEGSIYLLIDDGVYSASENFAVFCKATGFAKVVGRNSGGDGIGLAPMLVTLPYSGLLLQYCTLYGMNPDGSNNEEFGTTPDYISEVGETPLDTCLRIIRSKE